MLDLAGVFFGRMNRINKKVTEWVAVILLIHSISLILPKIAVKKRRNFIFREVLNAYDGKKGGAGFSGFCVFFVK